MNPHFLIVAFTILVLNSCSDGPESSAKNFTENLAKGKVDEAKKYATESTGKLIDFTSGFGGLHVDPDFKFNMEKDSIVENTAWITYVDEKGKKSIMKLVKIDGKWLVHIESKK